MSEPNTYYQEWVAIELLELSNFNGETIDLMPYFLNIDIQEDIFIPVCSGNLTIIDTSNLYEEFPIIGEETIKITYRDFYSKSITRTFNVYSVDNRERTTEKGSAYILNFCSEELLYNRTKKYSKSYKNALPHEIFLDAINRTNPSKEINIQPTKELQDFVVPNSYPFDVCAQMAARSISEEGQIGSYLFFEDNQKFNFISIEKLITKDPTIYQVGDAKLAGIRNPKYIFKNYKYQEPANNIKGIMSGSQGVETKTIDLMNRKLEDNSYDHFGDDYKKVNRVNSSNPELKTNSSTYKHKSGQGLSKIVVKNMSDSHKSTKNKTLALRYNILSSYMTGPKIHAELAFNSQLTVGDMIFVEIPKLKDNSDVPESDAYIQGKYIVTALRQIISPDSGETVVELAKDSYTKSHG